MLGHYGTLFETKIKTLFSLPWLDAAVATDGVTMSSLGREPAFILLRDDSAQANYTHAPPDKADDNASRNCPEGSAFHDDQARGEHGEG